MKASNVLLKSIRRFEGFRSKAYQDAKGVWTIGYGHTAQVKEGMWLLEKMQKSCYVMICSFLSIMSTVWMFVETASSVLMRSLISHIIAV